MDYNTLSLKQHKEKQGKIGIVNKFPPLVDKDSLSVAYTPGIGAVAKFAGQNKHLYRDYTIAGTTVAIVSDGSAVLGLGDIGPEGALPVMEGKALLLKEFADIDAFPIVLNTRDTDEIIRIVQAISPTFAAINLEDISAPRCFEIEEKLSQLLDIPVFHDDQHGTAIVVLAGLINAARLAHKSISDLSVVISGAGAAGIAITKLLHFAGITSIIVVDSQGAICQQRTDLNPIKRTLLTFTNPDNRSGSLDEMMVGADVFIGVSVANIVTRDMVKNMSPSSIVFALANPDPEIDPQIAYDGGAAVVATGRSDYPNQINNVLAFPGVFKGLLEGKIHSIQLKHMYAAAQALAALIPENDLTSTTILPNPFDKRVVNTVAQAIRHVQ